MDSGSTTFYGVAGSPPCCLALAVMDHVGVEYEVKEIVPMKDTRTEEFKKINPYGKVPVIQEGDFTLYESYAIARYYARRSTDEHFYPINDPKKVAKIDMLIEIDTQTFKKGFQNYTNETLFAPIFQGKEAPSADRKAELQKEVDDSFKVLSDILDRNGGEYVNGEHLSLADFIFFVSTFGPCLMSDAKYDTHSKVATWWEKIASLSVFSTLLEKRKETFDKFIEEHKK